MDDDDLSIQGDLAETTVPDLFRSLVRSGETAIVSLASAGYTDVIYFGEGRIISASSTDPDMGLAETLLGEGELNLQQYNEAMERVVVARRVGTLLCELGFLSPDGLIRAVERQASAIVLNALAYRDGSYTIEFTSNLPEGIIALPLATERLILDGVRRIDHWSLIVRGINRMERIVEPAPGADTRGYHLELSEEESHILSLLTEPHTIEALCARSYLTDFATCRTIWGLLSVNLLQDADGAEQIDVRHAAEATEYEIEGIVERYNTVFQVVFALVFQKVGDHVYDFVDRVVLHLSPETMPYLSGMTLVNEARIDVDQLLNNVIASGTADHAAIVQSVLDELLYGWIYEVKSEFGSAMESEVVRAAQALRR